MTMLLSPLEFRRYVIAFFALAALALMAAKVRADEPTRYYLEDGKVTAKKVAEHDTEIAALKKRVAELEARCQTKVAAAPCVCGDSCKCAAGDCPAKCPPAQAAPAAGSLVTLSGRKLLPNGNGTYRYADPEPVTACVGGTCAGGSCAVPSYAPQYLPSYTLPTAPQSCPNGRCPLPR